MYYRLSVLCFYQVSTDIESPEKILKTIKLIAKQIQIDFNFLHQWSNFHSNFLKFAPSKFTLDPYQQHVKKCTMRKIKIKINEISVKNNFMAYGMED